MTANERTMLATPELHPDALGVARFESSRFVTKTSTTLSITRVLLREGERTWESDVSHLQRQRPRPTVYCPFCGKPGQYALTDKYCYFRHGDGEPDCVPGALETLRHRRAKASLLKGLAFAREKGLSLDWTRTCRKCHEPMIAAILPPQGWSREEEEARLSDGDGEHIQPDVLTRLERAPTLAIEVRQTHAVRPETLQAYEVLGLPMIELQARDLIDDTGRETWDGSTPLPAAAAWRVPGEPSPHVCARCAAAAASATEDPILEALRALARAARRSALLAAVHCSRCDARTNVPLLDPVSREQITRFLPHAVRFSPSTGPDLLVAVGAVPEAHQAVRTLTFDPSTFVQGVDRFPTLPEPLRATGIPAFLPDSLHFCDSCRRPSAAAQDIDALWEHFAAARPELRDALHGAVERATGLPEGALRGRTAGWATKLDAQPEEFLGDRVLRPLAERGLRHRCHGLGILADAFRLNRHNLGQLGETLVDLLRHPHRAPAERLAAGEQVSGNLLRFADEVQVRLGLAGDEWARAAWTAHALADWSERGDTAAMREHLGRQIYKRVTKVYGKDPFPQRGHTRDWPNDALCLGVADRRFGGLVTLRCFSEAERAVARAVVHRTGSPTGAPTRIVSERALDPGQEHAVRCALRHRLSVVTGGAGTGKTTILRAIISSTPNERWLVAAPTGKAMNRAKQALGEPANVVGYRTIAKLIHQLEQPHSADLPAFGCLAVDEAGFLDLPAAAQLLEGLRGKRLAGTRIVLLGDSNQLSSVGPGAVLHDLLSATRPDGQPAVPQVRLERPFRNAGPIHAFAQSILEGAPRLDLIEFIYADDDAVVGRVEELVSGLDGRDVQVLASRRDLVGRLNKALRPILNPGARALNGKLFEGDRVVCTRNRYQFPAIMNGEVGMVSRRTLTPNGDDALWFQDDTDERGPFALASADLFEPAYALTVHKAQGSEWGTVVVALPGHHRVDRALLYTAATRARSRLVLVGSAQAVRSAASRAPPRQTELRQVLEQAVSAEVHT